MTDGIHLPNRAATVPARSSFDTPVSVRYRASRDPAPSRRRGPAALARGQIESGDPDAALPYWAFAWGGGLAIARYLHEHPEAVAGRRVFDLASGSGLCAIAAMRRARPWSRPLTSTLGRRGDRPECARQRPPGDALERDVLDAPPPDVDVVLVGDCWYEARLAERVLPWLQRVRARGIDVLAGDPGRRYLPLGDLTSSPPTRCATTRNSRTSSTRSAASMPCVPSDPAERLSERRSPPVESSYLVPGAPTVRGVPRRSPPWPDCVSRTT